MGNKSAKPVAGTGGTRPRKSSGTTPPPNGVAGGSGAAKSTADPTPSPPGLDAARHAAAQRAAHQADALRRAVFPALMADAIGLDRLFDGRSYKAYLEGLLRDAGSPTDPVEVTLVEQLALAHFRIGQLHATAGKAQGLEATKILNGVTSRLLGEFRRTALALRAYRGRVPEGKPAGRRSSCSGPPGERHAHD